ncbi:hypothetical protein PCL_09223 [Purpureocillium lilacinum]|uniref:Uncharacterized protein n=1 Tax=Purpureocillium lilacinum TaxID=33203 RepID=A0A2U3EHF0_PURLI|nr:hypothetical protein PCL_09223 [Purpureocillium lilacinum]
MHGGPVCWNPPAAVLPPPVDGRAGHPSTARMVAPSGLRNMDNIFEFGRTGRRDGAQEEECKCKENQERFPPLGWPLLESLRDPSDAMTTVVEAQAGSGVSAGWDGAPRPKKAVGRQDRESEADHSIGVGSRALFPFSLLNMESRSVVCAVRQRNWPTAVPLHVALSSSFCLVGTQQLESAECSSFHAACMAELR